jgi:P27 family predicted phage terminase small subunit
VLHGTHRKDRANPAEPQPEKGAPRPPSVLDATERRRWRQLAADLEGMGVLSKVDQGALLLLVTARVRYERLVRIVRREGEVLEMKETGKKYRNPSALAKERAFAEYTRLCVEFGVTPSSRSRVSIAPIAPPRDEAQDFFGDAPTAADTG